MSNRDITAPEVGKKVVLNVHCRDCLGFKSVAIYDKPCEQLGIQPHTKPCAKFFADTGRICFREVGMKEATAVVQKLPTSRLAALAAILNQESKTRKFGFVFGQKLMVRVIQGSGDYLSNYAVAKVIAADAERVYVQGRSGFRAAVFHESVMTMEDFDNKRKTLQRLNKLKDPKWKNYFKMPTKKLAEVDYEPPTIDSYDKVLRKEEKRKGRGKKRTTVLRVRTAKEDVEDGESPPF